MRKMVWMVVCLLSTAVACGQTAKDAVAAFQNSIGNQQWVLRNFSGEEVVHATWDGTQLKLDPPRWRTMAVVQVTSAKLSRGKVTLHCVRDVMVKEANDQLALYPETAEFKIEIELENPEVATVLPRVKGDLFFPSLKEAIAAVPAAWSKSPGVRIDSLPSAKKVSSPGSQPLCDCAVKGDTTCDTGSMQQIGLEPPRVLKMKDPDFPNTALRGPIDAHVVVGLIVSQIGHPVDVWVLRPAGMGLDEAAARAVLVYVFRPAMCHDKPVSVFLNVEVRFQHF